MCNSHNYLHLKIYLNESNYSAFDKCLSLDNVLTISVILSEKSSSEFAELAEKK